MHAVVLTYNLVSFCMMFRSVDNGVEDVWFREPLFLLFFGFIVSNRHPPPTVSPHAQLVSICELVNWCIPQTSRFADVFAQAA